MGKGWSCCDNDSSVSPEHQLYVNQKQKTRGEEKNSTKDSVDKYHKSQVVYQSTKEDSPSSVFFSNLNPEERPQTFIATTKELNLSPSKMSLTIKQFHQTSNYKQYENGERDIDFLIKLGRQAFKQGLLELSQEIFQTALNQVQLSIGQYSFASLKDAKLIIKQTLISIFLSKKQVNKKQMIQVERFFADVLKMYQELPENEIIDEKITMLNNFAIFYRKNNDLEKAIKTCEQTLKQAKKIFTKFDQRIYYIMINLACFYYENKNHQKADKISQRIENECPKEITQVHDIRRENQKCLKDPRKTY